MLGFYVASTYQTSPPTLRWSAPVLAFNAFFIAHWLLRVFLTQPGRRLVFVLSAFSLADISSIVSAILSAAGVCDTFMTLAFLRVCGIYESWLHFARWRASSWGCTRIQFVGVRVVIVIVTFAVFVAATVATIERASEAEDWGETAVSSQWQAVNALYFSFVTLGTVGEPVMEVNVLW
jgi:hypothetical protein